MPDKIVNHFVLADGSTAKYDAGALLNLDDRTALVLTAGLADAMGHAEFAAVGALDEIGSGELPDGRTSLVTSLTRYFSFRDCHVDTSCLQLF